MTGPTRNVIFGILGLVCVALLTRAIGLQKAPTAVMAAVAAASAAPCPGANYAINTTMAVTPVPGTTDIGNHCDDCDTLISFPFPFTLYDQTFTAASASSNGRLEFVSNNEPGFAPSCLPAPPNVGPYDYTIFPLWHDMRTDTGLSGCATLPGGCGIFTTVTGSAPNRTFYIDFHTVRFADNAQGERFEVRLYENSPTRRFDVIYDATAGITGSDTAGVQGPTSQFTQAFCNTTPPPSGTLHTYTLPDCATPTPTRTSTLTSTRTATPTPTRTPTPPAFGFFSLPPCRVADTRNAVGPFGGPPLAAGVSRAFPLIGICGIPANATAASLNLTVTGPTAGGHIVAYPSGTSVTLSSTVNFNAGQTRANNAIVRLGTGGAISVISGQPSGNTVHLIIDVNGYFRSPAP